MNVTDNSPIPRAHIRFLAEPDTGEWLTDANGLVTLPPPTSADTQIEIAHTGFLSVTTPYATLRQGGFVAPMTPAGIIAGQVIWASGATAAAIGIRVTRVPASDDVRAAGETMKVFTNDVGEFRLAGLPAGRYRVLAYFDSAERSRLRQNDATFQPGLPTPLDLIEPLSDILDVSVDAGKEADVRLVVQPEYPFQTDSRRQGVIAGTVFDEFGDPIQGVAVRLWRPTGSSKVLEQTGPVMMTDDRGRYRLFGLGAAPYVVEARRDRSVPGGHAAPTYAPGTTAIGQAGLVRSDGRTEIAGVDINVRPSRLARVQGTVVSPTSGRFYGFANLVHEPTSGGVRLPRLIAQLGADGSFAFDRVPPGNYALHLLVSAVFRPQPGERSTDEAALELLSISDDDPAPLRVVVTPVRPLKGRVVAEGGQVVPTRVLIGYHGSGPLSLDPPSQEGALALNGQFTIFGATAPLVLTLSSAPKGWWLKSIRTPAVHSPQEPISPDAAEVTLVLAPTGASLSGRVLADPADRRTSVIVFPVDRKRWRVPSRDVALLEPDDKGQFVVESLAPGDYYVVALAHATDHPDWDDISTLLNTLAGSARRVSLAEGQTLGVDLRLIDALR